MARGRSAPAFERLYIDGYDMSGYTMDTGEQGMEYPDNPTWTWTDPVTGCVCGAPVWSFGPVNGVFDNTATSGIHVLADAAKGTRRNITHARGVQAAPAIGDDVFCAPMMQQAYKRTGDTGIVTVSMAFSGPDNTSGLLYNTPWGVLLHPFGSETAANTANTNSDNGASSALGGWLMYHITSITGTGTVTISVDDSANGTVWAALASATTGAIATATAPTSGFIQIGITATVRQYLRWQIAFGGSATACTFALSFMRGR